MFQENLSLLSLLVMFSLGLALSCPPYSVYLLTVTHHLLIQTHMQIHNEAHTHTWFWTHHYIYSRIFLNSHTLIHTLSQTHLQVYEHINIRIPMYTYNFLVVLLRKNPQIVFLSLMCCWDLGPFQSYFSSDTLIESLEDQHPQWPWIMNGPERYDKVRGEEPWPQPVRSTEPIFIFNFLS